MRPGERLRVVGPPLCPGASRARLSRLSDAWPLVSGKIAKVDAYNLESIANLPKPKPVRHTTDFTIRHRRCAACTDYAGHTGDAEGLS